MNKKTRLTLAAAVIATFSGAVLAAPETFIIDGSHKLENIVIVIKRLANPHNNNMADALTLSTLIKIFLHHHDL